MKFRSALHWVLSPIWADFPAFSGGAKIGVAEGGTDGVALRDTEGAEVGTIDGVDDGISLGNINGVADEGTIGAAAAGAALGANDTGAST
jgi:hypothetical protein